MIDFSKLDDVHKAIEKELGEGVVRDVETFKTIERVPCSLPSLADVLGGGWPIARIVEIFGPESSGKSAIATLAGADFQRVGKFVAYIDVEYTFDYGYAQNIGLKVDSQNFKLYQPLGGEEAFEIAEKLCKAGVDLIIFDSVAAMTPKSEGDAGYGDMQMGAAGRMMGKGLRKIASVMHTSRTTLIFINQLRCISKDSLVIRNNILDSIGNVRVGDYIDNKKVLSIYDSGEISGIELRAKSLYPLSISLNHKQPVISENGYEEKTGEKIKVGDWLISPIPKYEDKICKPIDISSLIMGVKNNLTPNSKDCSFPSILDERLSFILGAYYSDGSFIDYPEKSHYGIQWTENNRERYELIKETLDSLGIKASVSNTTIRLLGKFYLDIFEELGCNRYGVNKNIPQLILDSSLSIQKSFIRGCFFDTHGFNKMGFIFTNENPNSLNQFSVLLYKLGVISDVRDSYLYITGKDAIDFNNLIGFSEKTKQEKAKKFIEPTNARGKYDVVPYSYGVWLLDLCKATKTKSVTSFPLYNNLNMCRANKLNFCRKTLIFFLDFMEGKSIEREFISSNRFYEIEEVVSKSIDAIDIEIEGEGLFTTNRILTHNSKIGVMYGPTESSTGGRALPFFASIRLDTRKTENIERGDEVLGIVSKVSCKKNKTAAVGKKCEVKLDFTTGYNIFEDYIENAVSCKIVDKAGSWYSYKGEKLGQGVDKVTTFFKDKPEIFAKVKKQVDSFVQKQCIESADKTGEIDDETGEVIQEGISSEESVEETPVETKNDIAADVPKKRGRKPKVKVEDDIDSVNPVEDNE